MCVCLVHVVCWPQLADTSGKVVALTVELEGVRGSLKSQHAEATRLGQRVAEDMDYKRT